MHMQTYMYMYTYTPAASEPDEEGTTLDKRRSIHFFSVDLFTNMYAWIYEYMPMPIYTYIQKYLGRFGARRGRHDAGGGGDQSIYLCRSISIHICMDICIYANAYIYVYT